MKRVTIMIDDELDKKLRQRQSKMIRESNSSVSYSRVINELLDKYLK
ncbi:MULTISPECIES: hypothetical protein [Nitrosopumilus]|nr:MULTISPECIES: hypothetical protein [Nitrosopumilus]